MAAGASSAPLGISAWFVAEVSGGLAGSAPSTAADGVSAASWAIVTVAKEELSMHTASLIFLNFLILSPERFGIVIYRKLKAPVYSYYLFRENFPLASFESFHSSGRLGVGEGRSCAPHRGDGVRVTLFIDYPFAHSPHRFDGILRHGAGDMTGIAQRGQALGSEKR